MKSRMVVVMLVNKVVMKIKLSIAEDEGATPTHFGL